MKTNNKLIYLLILFTCFSFWSCEKYLDKTIKADISEADVLPTSIVSRVMLKLCMMTLWIRSI
jgi:hypothetical protein